MKKYYYTKKPSLNSIKEEIRNNLLEKAHWLKENGTQEQVVEFLNNLTIEQREILNIQDQVVYPVDPNDPGQPAQGPTPTPTPAPAPAPASAPAPAPRTQQYKAPGPGDVRPAVAPSRQGPPTAPSRPVAPLPPTQRRQAYPPMGGFPSIRARLGPISIGFGGGGGRRGFFREETKEQKNFERFLREEFKNGKDD